MRLEGSKCKKEQRFYNKSQLSSDVNWLKYMFMCTDMVLLVCHINKKSSNSAIYRYSWMQLL